MKILVVDDEIDMQPLFEQRFRKELRSGEITLNFAFSGYEAIGYMQAHAQEAVLILSDINMPGMSGLELLRQIKEQFACPPAIVMMVTAYGDGENYNRAMALGADDFITKPVDFTALKEKLKHITS